MKLIGLCLLAGVLIAGMLFPAFGAMGVVSNRLSDSIYATTNNLTTVDPPSVSVVTDKDGKPIAYLYQQYRTPVSSNQISPIMKAAVVAIEDHRFYEHKGIDLQSTLRALLSNEANGATQGASTLTQQYVKNYLILVAGRNNETTREQAQEQTISRKIREARIAIQLEQNLSKDEILTRYLNLVTFVGKVDGVGTAAQVFFNTTADKLTIPQSALLAGVINNPVQFNPWEHPQAAKNRRDQVIDAMVNTGKIPKDTGLAAKNEPLGVVTDPNVPPTGCVGTAPENGFFCAYVESYLEHAGFSLDQLETGGYTIKTTLDPQIAKTAKAATEKNVPKTTNGIANTFVIIQPGQQSHDVLALVANRDYGLDTKQGQTLTNLPTSVSVPFGAGSIYKLFTSAAAMEQGKAGINTVLPNPPSQCFQSLDPRAPCHTVSNDGKYATSMSLENALASSPNTLFVNLELQTGMQNVLNMASRLGMRETLQTNEIGGKPVTDPSDPNSTDPRYNQPQSQYFQNNFSFTLGVSPLSPLELANVGATLMSGGVWCAPTPVKQVLDSSGKEVPFQQQACEQAVAPGVANTLVNGMSKDTAPGGTTGTTAALAGWHRKIAAKTGTTEYNESVGFLGAMQGYAASSLVFADGANPATICSTTPPRLSTGGIGGCSGAFGGAIAAPTFFTAFNQILGNQADPGLPAPDPQYLNVGSRGPGIPWVVGQNTDSATQAIKQAGYQQVSTLDFNSTEPKGTVVGQSVAGSQPQSTEVKLYVSTGFVPKAPGAEQDDAGG